MDSGPSPEMFKIINKIQINIQLQGVASWFKGVRLQSKGGGK